MPMLMMLMLVVLTAFTYGMWAGRVEQRWEQKMRERREVLDALERIAGG